MLPGVGALPDGVNAALYAAEGDYVNAGLSAAAAVPGIGDGATAAKYAAKYGDEVAAIAKTAGDFCSFRADTPVLTPEGRTPIAAINVGDHVLAYHEGLHTTGTYTVTAVWAHRDPVVVTLLLDDEVIETTPEHPFFVAGRGWTPAGALVAGSTIQQADGTTGVVHAMQMEHRSQVMYNFTVADAHTYFVGEGGWLVHNQCGPYEVGLYKDLIAKSVGDDLEIHHLPQSKPASQVIPNYKHTTGTAIALPTKEHRSIPTQKGVYYGTSQDLIAKDLADLAKHTNAPASAIQQLTNLIDSQYPGAR
jgi:hypothetical protein